MPLYTFKCESCGEKHELLVKTGQDISDCPNCYVVVKDGETVLGKASSIMRRVLDTPSAPQWKCGAAHSRSKGF